LHLFWWPGVSISSRCKFSKFWAVF
jgi:hypothetical protein